MLFHRPRFLISFIALALFLPACGGTTPNDRPTEQPEPVTSNPNDTAAFQPPTDAPLTGPLVGFYVEDSYEDVYLSIYDASTGGLRVLHGGVPIYLGEAQWFDNGCHLFVQGQLTDLHGDPHWEVPAEAEEQIEHLNTARLSPDRRWIADLLGSGLVTGQGAAAADIQVVSLLPPYAAARLSARGGAEPRALAWSADTLWLYFTDFDENGVLQVYRGAPDGGAIEQLTRHAGPVGAMNALAPSPDGRYLAYSVQNLLQAVHPYTHRLEDEGWVGILDLAAGTTAEVRPAKFGSAEPGRGLIWDASSERLLIIGDSLPVPTDDPAAGRQVHWVTATGQVAHSLATAEGPEGPESHLGWIVPLGNIDTLLVSVRDDFYVYIPDGGFRRLEAGDAPPVGMAFGRRAVGILPAPFGFPGEAACGP